MSVATISDVATMAGVSIKTVSRVINREPHVRDITKARVLAAATDLTYRPNLAARSLAGGRTNLIGYYAGLTCPYYAWSIQAGAMMRCQQAGFHLVVEHIHRDQAVSLIARHTIEFADRLHGLILAPPFSEQSEFLDMLDERGIDYVRIAPSTDLERSKYVRIDHEQAAYEMARHLIGLGHRRIQCLWEHPAASAALYEGGLGKACDDAGLPRVMALQDRNGGSIEASVQAAREILSRPDRPTAICVDSNVMACGIIAAANALRVAVPKDLSVVALNHSDLTPSAWPRLTAVRHPAIRMAQAAAHMLVSAGDKGSAGLTLEFDIVLGDSSSSPSPAH